MNERLLRAVIRDELAAFSAPQLLTAEEASTVLKVTVPTLSNWRSAGRGPTYIMVEGSIRYGLADLHAYLTKRSVSS